MELFLLSPMVSADEALRIGLVNRVVPAGDLATAASEVAAQLAAGPTTAYKLVKQMVKELMLRAPQQVFEDLLKMEGEYQATAGDTEDHARAVAAFLDKQEATFTGR
jgi:2-(1,2-epoxy-1,2-dihydrophenyl)acetyl-CoA isomerase